MSPDTVGLWLLAGWTLPPSFHVVTLASHLACYCNFLVCDSTVDTFDYHIKFILHKNCYQLSAFAFFKPLRQFSIRHSTDLLAGNRVANFG